MQRCNVRFVEFYFFFGAPGLAFLELGLLPLISWNKITKDKEKMGSQRMYAYSFFALCEHTGPEK
jgi:hypothetical protein